MILFSWVWLTCYGQQSRNLFKCLQSSRWKTWLALLIKPQIENDSLSKNYFCYMITSEKSCLVILDIRIFLFLMNISMELMFLYHSPENTRKPKAFWCFQGYRNEILGENGWKTEDVIISIMISAKVYF